MYYYLQEVKYNHGIFIIILFSKDRGIDDSKIEVEPLANRPL